MLFKLHPNPRERQGSSRVSYIATLLNPVDHRLYDIIDHPTAYMVVAPMPNTYYEEKGAPILEFGEGSYDTSDEKELEYDRSYGTYYRSHTPGGVTKKKAGLGLMLYSGLSLATVRERGDGIFSETASRSADATRWWKSQTQRDFAEETEAYSSGYGTVTVDIDEDQIDVKHLAERGYFGEEMEDVEDVSIEDGPDPSYVEVSLTVGGSVSVQYLPATKVVESGIVLAWNTDDDDLDSVVGKFIQYPSPRVLSEIDMSTVGDPALILELWRILEDSDITESQKKRFLSKVPRGSFIDADPRILEMMGQLRFPFEELSQEDIAANPSRSVKHSKAWKEAFGPMLGAG